MGFTTDESRHTHKAVTGDLLALASEHDRKPRRQQSSNPVAAAGEMGERAIDENAVQSTKDDGKQQALSCDPSSLLLLRGSVVESGVVCSWDGVQFGW